MAIKTLLQGVKVCIASVRTWSQESVFGSKECLLLFSWYDNTLGGLDVNSNTKSGHCGTSPQYALRILNHFTPYFDGLRECCLALWGLFFGYPRVDITHDEMCGVLQQTLYGLMPESPTENPVTPQNASIEDINATYHGTQQTTVQEEPEEEQLVTMWKLGTTRVTKTMWRWEMTIVTNTWRKIMLLPTQGMLSVLCSQSISGVMPMLPVLLCLVQVLVNFHPVQAPKSLGIQMLLIQ